MPRAQKAAKGEKRGKRKTPLVVMGKSETKWSGKKKALGGGEGAWERKSGKNT